MTRELFEQKIFWILRILGILFFVIVVGFPFYWMFISSIRPLTELLANPTNLGINLWKIDLSGYRQVLDEFKFGDYFKNSLYISSITMVLTTILAIPGAYTIVRMHFWGKRLMSRSVLLIYMFPPIVLVVPLYVIFVRLGIRDSLNSLIIVYIAQTLPIALYLLVGYFRTLPPDLEDAGMVDGCSRLGVIWRITIPVSLPAIVTVMLFTFTIAWNEFLFALIFLDSPAKFTLPRGLWQFAFSVDVAQQLIMAASMMITVPVLVFFVAFERYLVKGLTAGAIKG